MANASISLRIPAGKLRRACDPRMFTFRTTADLAPIEGTVGQDRAVKAMQFALDIEADGFNLFVNGPTGTGRESELRAQVERIAQQVGRLTAYDVQAAERLLVEALIASC